MPVSFAKIQMLTTSLKMTLKNVSHLLVLFLFFKLPLDFQKKYAGLLLDKYDFYQRAYTHMLITWIKVYIL